MKHKPAHAGFFNNVAVLLMGGSYLKDSIHQGNDVKWIKKSKFRKHTDLLH